MASDLTLICHPRWLLTFNTLLQKGIQAKCLTNRCLMDLLMVDFQLSHDYITQRIQTITLDGRPVDDLTTAVVRPNARLAISGAMPGLAGATLRKGGHFASLRSTISYCRMGEEPLEQQAGFITVKLFNLILKDLGVDFLHRGIGVAGKELVPLVDEIVASASDDGWHLSASGKDLEWQTARQNYKESPLVFMAVDFEEKQA